MENIISKIFKKIRETIYYYYILQYNVEEFGIEDNDEFYVADESLFTHHKNEQI